MIDQSLSPMMTNSLSASPEGPPQPGAMAPAAPAFNEKALLDFFEKCKKDTFSYRWVWEREWLRDIFYTANRQWIYYNPTRREWVDKRLAKNVPRPTTNKIAEVVQSLRASFGQVDLGVVARPVGHNPTSVATAEIVDNIAPLIHEEHRMNAVMRESDFWLIVTGNACLQVSWDQDNKFNKVFIPFEKCQACGQVSSPADIVDKSNMCPACGGGPLVPATNPDGTPAGEQRAYGRGKTTALSPFEYAFPASYTRFDELPYIFRLRWREKAYYEANHPELMAKMVWETQPSDRSLQIYKSLAMMNDAGGATNNQTNIGGQGNPTGEGITEYELWVKPSKQFPDGFVMRIAGDRQGTMINMPEEGLPGPIPYKDAEGCPVWPFCHATFEHVGGRLYGRSALSPLIQKQDQINQLDSLTQMIVQRMANPVWIVPENAGIDSFTGDPGLVVKWNSLAAGGNAKPERIAGENIPPTLFQLREQYMKDMEELSGAYDILKGNKPAGVEAFSALQLLVEKSMARFASAFKARGEMYQAWFSVAIELERQFGPQNRVMSVVSPNKGYTFREFEKAQLQGNVTIHIEDGTDVPKTALGKRAAVEHANQLGLLDPHDIDQKWAMLNMLGLSDLVPTLDTHVQTALQIQDGFEQWADNPQGPSPLVIKPWFDPKIHYGERIKWLNTDHMRDLLTRMPQMEPIIIAHLQQLSALVMQMAMVGQPGQPGGPPAPPPPGGVGAGRTMSNSNTNSGSSHPNGPPPQNGPPQ